MKVMECWLMIKFIDLNYKQFKTTEIARCLKARYTAAPTNHTCENSGILIGRVTWK